MAGFNWAEKYALFLEIPKHLRFEVAQNLHAGAARRIGFFKGRDPMFV